MKIYIKSSTKITKQAIIDNGGSMHIGDWSIEIGKLYNKDTDSYSGGFGKKTTVCNFKKGLDRVFNSPEKAIEFLTNQLKNENKYVKSSIYKRIARTEEFDNGRVLHNDWLKISDEEAEKLAQKKSNDYPGSICYVQYDDIMNPSSDIYWVDGVNYTNYQDALKAHQNHISQYDEETRRLRGFDT